ncbi:MAG: flippase-like domain-containing protein [Planctomycetes bacterium]|nr:flippase-like domain-containing protein [Planctomycetota bacterium]
MLKWLKHILGVAILAFLIWYLAGHWQQVRVLLKLSAAELIIIYFVCFLGTLNGAAFNVSILRPMGAKVLFWDMVMLQNTSVLLNYLPMKFGTFFKANYLKRHYGLKYSHYGTFAVYLTLVLSAVASLAGMIVLALFYGLADVNKQILAGIFLISFVFSCLLIFLPLPVPKGVSKPAVVLRDFLLGRKAITQDRKVLLITSGLLFLNFVLTSVRLGVIYHSMDKDIHPAGYLVLGAMGFVMMFINLTPGALGIREAVLGAGAVVLGIPLEAGITAAMIDRAVVLSWVFVVGGGSSGWLWYKSPADFKKVTNNA